mmetsp:Transcript_122118/g.353021  ORF Transcript_122118/g.353021 Transcript_122118/m.353021 type:complete len:460 (-) Transcript_122118:554-1933(-)
MPWERAVRDPRHVRRLPDILAEKEHVVRKVPGDPVALRQRCGYHHAYQSDVLHVPRVPIGQRRAIRDARELVAVVPPCEDTCVRSGVITKPPVGLADLVVDVPLFVPRDDARVGERIPGFVKGVLVEIQCILLRGPYRRRRHTKPQQSCWPSVEDPQRGIALLKIRWSLDAAPNRRHGVVERSTERAACKHTDGWPHQAHETRHLQGEELAACSEHQHEQRGLRGPCLEVEKRQRADQRHAAGVVQIRPICVWTSRPVLADRIDKRISGLRSAFDEERTDAAGQWGEVSGPIKRGDGGDEDGNDEVKHRPPPRCLPQAHELHEEEHEQWAQLLQRLEWCPTHRRHGCSEPCAGQEEQRVRTVHLRMVVPEQHEQGGMRSDNIEQEDIATPRRGHATVGYACQSSNPPRPWRPERPRPEEERRTHGCYGDRLVVEAAAHALRGVSGDDGHDGTTCDKRST